MKHEPITQLTVTLQFNDQAITVGRLAIRDRMIYFEYATDFLDSGLEISPLKCPLRSGVQTFEPHLFEGLAGVFNDSIPDGWGRLLLDRQMKTLGIAPEALSPLDRLAYVGSKGIGALCYAPEYDDYSNRMHELDLDRLASGAEKILAGEASATLQELIALNGSSAGARPKALIGVHDTGQSIIHGTDTLPSDYSHWMVKFANIHDGLDAGAVEYVYSIMAKKAGLEMPETMLFPAETGAGYFAVQRFERNHNVRLHKHTACGLLHTDFRTPTLDYKDLLNLTGYLCKDIHEVEKMYRLAVFNVLSHNRDDHGKNFAFLMDEHGDWRLAPAYDLTFSSGPNGEQSTTVMGTGKNPSTVDLINLGLAAKIPRPTVDDIIHQTRDALSAWRRLATEYAVTPATKQYIADHFSLS